MSNTSTAMAVVDVLDDEWLTTAEAAAYVRRHPVTVRKAAADGTLRSTSSGSGRGRRYRKSWLREWLDAPRRARRHVS